MHIQVHRGEILFILHLLLLQWPPDTSLTVEYPSESAPPHSGEDGGEFPLPPAMGQAFGGFPCGLAVVNLADLLPPLSSADPSLVAEGGTPHQLLGRIQLTCGMSKDRRSSALGPQLVPTSL